MSNYRKKINNTDSDRLWCFLHWEFSISSSFTLPIGTESDVAHELVKHHMVPVATFGSTESQNLMFTSPQGEVTCLDCSCMQYAECILCHSPLHIFQANPAGRQTDATVVNIFWPWDQLLRLVEGGDKPHRMVQAGLSSSAKPEEDLCYRWTNWQRKNNNLAP